MNDNRTKNRTKKSGAATFFYFALTLPALTAAASAYADDGAPQPTTSPSNPQALAQTLPPSAQVSQAVPAGKRRAEQGGTVRTDQPDTTSALVNAEADQAVTPPTPPSSQASSKGFIADSHLNLLLRNYADYFQAPPSLYRHAWVQGVQANYESGFTQGPVGFGVDASLFGALKLDGGNGAGNMVHVAKGGGGSEQLAWAYPGMYDIKGRISETVVKYGLQTVTNPFLEPHDNRALPPTFLGVSMVSNDLVHTTLEAGSFTRVDARGHTNLTNLTTSYGGTRIDRLTYVGGTWHYAKDGEMALYADQADDVWRQYYGSVAQSFGDPATIKWSGLANIYSTHDTGASRQGHINSNAYSVSISAQHGPHALLLGYQQVLGEQFFDYVNETNGIYLTNSMDVDYNAPHEQSLQLRYTFDGKYAGVPGLKAMFWGVYGWGADASAEAAQNASPSAPLHDLYWKSGEPVSGHHHEFGFIPSYTLQSGRFKDTKVTFIAMWHNSSRHYSDGNNMEYRLVVNVPVKVF
ncbi:OprD family outer membrane porin [Paraburkholderia lacunae]|uniref:Outer membrane porin, OprD family n=1 Tax=Paraburkholderia lacunae TaxID=2211104 RepID=A0A370NBS3_9BURK|nr:OprD family outer membrane porin [Paraburkholderia lacunae]RDK03046.1 outer membrane porin, OprD family [Paraburkholderia lacunae]